MRIASMALFGLVFMATSPHAENQIDRMNQVIDNLIASYNAVDSVSYRKHFSPKFLIDVSLSDIGESLRSGGSDEGFGKIVRADREIDSNGDRAIVVLHFEKNAYDMHLRIDKDGKLTRDTWLPNKAKWDDVITMTYDEIESERALYENTVNRFADAFMKKDASKLVPLFPVKGEEEDALALEKYKQIFSMFEEKGGIQKVGEISYLGAGNVSIPLMVSDIEGYEFIITVNSIGLIGDVNITNWAAKESEGKSLADLGADSLKTVDLTSVSQLADVFRADSGKVRFITLLSPT